MKRVKQLFDFYINSSIHVALAVYSLSYLTLLEYDISYDENILYFIFFATITGYNFVKYFGIAKFHHRSLTNWLKAIQVFSLFSFILMLYYVSQLHTNTLFYILIFALITFLYAIPFLPKRFFLDGQHNLRTISGLKIYLIALVWSGVTVFIPLINNDYYINTDVVITAAQLYVFVLVLMLPFEIRDLRYDSLKLSTVPQKIGVKQTKMLGVLLLSVFFILDFFKNETSSATKIFILIGILTLTALLVLFAKKEQGKYYSAFWVEGLPILWLILVLYFN